MAKHSIFSPSSSDRWIECPASISMCSKLPKPETSIYAMNGSACHYVAEQCLTKNLPVSNFIDTVISVSANQGDQSIDFTSEMADIVSTYLNELELLRQEYPKCEYKTEQTLQLKPQPVKEVKIFGTIDYNIVEPFGDIVIADLKSGAGVSVDPMTSNQTRLYGVIALQNDWKEYERLRMIIIQPKDKHGDVRKEYSIPISELKEWYHDVCIPAIINARSKNPTFGPSDKACRWCAALETCKAAARHVLSAAVEEFDDGFVFEEEKMKTPDKFTNDEIGDLLPIIDLYNAWASAVKIYAINELSRGRKIKGYKLVEGKSNRQWVDESKAEAFLKRLKMKVADLYTKKFKSPAQIEKLIPKDKREKLKPHIEKPRGKPALAKESSKKPELKLAAAEFDDDFFS